MKATKGIFGGLKITLGLTGRIRASSIFHLLLLLAMPAAVEAQFTYETNNGTLTITAYTGPGGYVNIPDTINGLPVTRIGNFAFYWSTSVTSVTTGDNVISIGDSAFSSCTHLTSVTIGNSVSSIGWASFEYCTSLTSVTIGNSVTNIGGHAFESCTSLTSVVLPNTVSRLGDSVFVSCTSLTNVTIGDHVPTIGNWVFYNCTNLVSITIPKSVTNILDGAFYNCFSLAGVYFAGNAASVGSEVFSAESSATVYCLPGTTGWGSTFGGRPTALWSLPNPLILTTAPSFGVGTKGFGFIISWATSVPVVVEACTDLANPDWIPVGTNTLTDGWSYFSDPEWTNYPGRFYRLLDGSLLLRVVAADATTIQLNWPPTPTAVEYRVYRDGAFAGSTAGRCGYFLDTGLAPATAYRYSVAAFDAANTMLELSRMNSFSTTSTNRIRTRYTVLAIGFYPHGPDAELPHVKTFFRHKLDFFRLASVNLAVLQPYKNDIICIRATPPLLHSPPSPVDYVKLATTPYPELDGYSMVDLVEKGEVDVVWITAAPDTSEFCENALVGNKDLNQTLSGERWFPYPAKCSRSFFINFGSADARAYDAYAHCIEGIMSCLCDGNASNWPRTYPYTVYSKTRTDFTTTFPASLHLFERFRLADRWNGTAAYASAGNGNCGSSHFPPNARRDTSGSYDGDYAYYDTLSWQRYIDCAADGWLSFPALSGVTRKLNGYDFGAFNHYLEGDPAYGGSFGASPQLHSSFRFGTDSYHQWWFFHLPHNPGVTDGKLNNWWPYIFDFNRFNGSFITYSVEGPQVSASVLPVNGEYGTELGSDEWWGYWQSCCDFGPFGRVSVVSRASSSNLVCRGQYALEVKIDQESFQDNGRNDAFYPISRNARWNLSHLREVGVSIKLGLHAECIGGANPVIRLCANGGNRIELAPLKNGCYANLFLEGSFADQEGWFTFNAPINGDSNWEVNVLGYLDPALGANEILAARQQLKEKILSEVNYVEISVRSLGSRGTQASYYIDGLQFLPLAQSAAQSDPPL